MWDDAEAAVSNSQMHADQTYVLLGSGNAKAQIEVSMHPNLPPAGQRSDLM